MTKVKLADPIGLPLDRVDGQLKVTGRATYAFEYATQGGAAYGVIVPAAMPRGASLPSTCGTQSARPECCSC
jgi:Aerobic-type carbon monoxide dehydrogenase, large subunit CoxL/CutL homologs